MKRLLLLSVFLMNLFWAFSQTTISLQDFEISPATPTLTFANVGGATSTGNNGASGRPASADLFATGVQGWQALGTTSTLTFANQSLSGYTDCLVDFRLAGMSANNTNGIDDNDFFTVSISVDGGTNYSSEIVFAGSTSNQYWPFSATGTSTTTYDGDNIPTSVPVTTGSGITKGTINIPNGNSQVRIRISMSNGSNERWVVDDVRIRGTVAAAPTQLAITSISPTSPTAGSAFNVTVQSQTSGGVPSNVTTSTGFDLSINGYGGTLGGVTMGTIAAGASSVVLSGVTLSTAGTGAILTATQTSGTPILTAGNSATFNVLEPASQLEFVGFPATGLVGTNFSSFTVEARRPDNTLDNSFTGSITLTKNTGPGTLGGTLSATAVAGVATFAAVQVDMPGTYSLYANSGSLTQATSSSIVVSDVSLSSDYYRSNVTSGTWSTAGTWQTSHDGSTNWFTSTLVPNTSAGGIFIRNGHTITVSTEITVDDVVIEDGGKMVVNSTNGTLNLSNGTATNDLNIESGGIFQVLGTASYSTTIIIATSANFNISSGGKVMIGDGTSLALSGYGTFASSSPATGGITWNNASIFEWNTTGSLPANSGVTWFPGVSAGVIPIARMSALPAVPQNFGGTGSGTMTINGLLEANVAMNFGSTGTKTIRNGIIGTSSVTQTSNSIFSINGTTAQIGGAGTLILASAGSLTIGSSTTVTLTSNKTVNSGTINLNGSLLGGEFAISGTAAFTSGASSTLTTALAGGLNSVIAVNGIKTHNTSASYVFNGSSAQVTGAALTSCKDLTINNSAGVSLSSSIESSGTTTFTAGKITLGSNNLTTANTTGASSSNYVVTNGSGTLTLTNISGSGKLLPIGFDANSYDPIFVSNNDGMTSFSARVDNTIDVTTGLTMDYVVPREWNISSASANASIEFQTSATPNSTTATKIVGHYTGSVWEGLTNDPMCANFSDPHWCATSTSFSPFIVAYNQALPVELTVFSAKKLVKSNLLSWQTATETNTAHFQIQRSADAENWQTIGEVKAAGESRETKNYSFTDENPLPISYYRLRSVDFDGAEQFSQVERVERQGATKAPYVLPTNVENETTVVFESELERDANVIIFDMMGRQVFSQAVAIQKGENRQPLDLGSLPKGAYTLQVSGNESAPARFVKM